MNEGARKKEEYRSMPDEAIAYRETDHHCDRSVSCRQPSAYLTPQRLKQGFLLIILIWSKPGQPENPIGSVTNLLNLLCVKEILRGGERFHVFIDYLP